MPGFNRNSFRLACLLQQALRRRHVKETAISLPRWEWQRCQELSRKLEKARSRNFRVAAATVARDLDYALSRLRTHLDGLLTAHEGSSRGPQLPPLISLYDEVQGLFEEFDAVKAQVIVVTTEPIELGEVPLGRASAHSGRPWWFGVDGARVRRVI
jgi:hypothetical protein